RPRSPPSLSEQLTALHKVSIALSKAPSFDAMCRSAVELGRERLGFDRLGIWFTEPGGQSAVGSFGTDEHGRLRDERQSRVNISAPSAAGRVIGGKPRLACRDGGPIYNNKAWVVGHGHRAVA